MSIQIICVEKIFPTDKDEHENIMNTSCHNCKNRLKAAFYTKKLWPLNSIIKINFLENNPSIIRTSKSDIHPVNSEIDPLQQYFFDNPTINIVDAVKKIIKERIQPLVSLKFVYVNDKEDSDIRISFDSNAGAWSLVGTDCKKEDKNNATMNLGWFDVSTVIHEFGHVLGMIHEHQNPRGKSIQWNKPAVYNWASQTQGWDKQKTEENIMNKYEINHINGSSFDPLSIMLYFFPADLTTNNKGTYQNLRLSGEDVKYITEQYGKDKYAETIFKDMYNENIYENIYKSMAIAKNDQNYGKNNVMYITIILIIAIVILSMAYLFYHKKKK
jgi:hypothetical protein